MIHSPAAVCVLMIGLTITVSTSGSVYAQSTGDTDSTQRWCENKKDELKDRVSDLMLVFFAPSASRMTISDVIDEANVLVSETEAKMVDCADYLTGTEIQMLQAMHDAAAFFGCTAEMALKVLADPGAYDVETLFSRCLTAES